MLYISCEKFKIRAEVWSVETAVIVMADTPPSSPRPTGPQQARIIELSTGLREFLRNFANQMTCRLWSLSQFHVYFQQGESPSRARAFFWHCEISRSPVDNSIRLRSRIPIASAEPSTPSVAYLNPGAGAYYWTSLVWCLLEHGHCRNWLLGATLSRTVCKGKH